MSSFALGLGQTRSLRSLKQFPRYSEGGCITIGMICNGDTTETLNIKK